MGRVVTLAQLPASRIAGGIESASITQGEMREMAAELIRIAPGSLWTATVPHGSDCYLFMLNGVGAIAAGNAQFDFPAQAFATLQEGVEFTVENDSDAAADIVKVIAPPSRISVNRRLHGQDPSGRTREDADGRSAGSEKESASIWSVTTRPSRNAATR